MTTFFYSAYGLRFSCDFPLPELMPAPEETGRAAPDVELQLSPALRKNPPLFLARVECESAQIEWPDVGRFWIQNGSQVRIEPAPHADQATWHAFLLGPVLAILLFQRDFLVLHASAVALRDASGQWGAIGFVGRSGDGKSTMAAALHARGHRLISDDIIAIPPLTTSSQNGRFADNSPQLPAIFPAIPQLRLWPEAVRALGAETNSLPLLYPQQERRIWRAAPGFEASAVPLRALFLLQNGDEIAMMPLSPARALMQLLEHIYCVETGDEARTAAQFARCGALARTLPVFELQRPKDLTRLSEVAARIEDKFLSYIQSL